MTADLSDGEKPKPTLGQAIDQVISALDAFNAADRQTILRAVYAHLNIAGFKAENTDPQGEPEPPREDRTTRPSGEADNAGMDIRTFKQQKNPTSARQMACLVAYYLSEIATGEKRKLVITSADIEQYFKHAGYPLTKPDQLLIDCKKSGYFDSLSRGEYKLTRVGHNLVAHQLPAKGKG